MVCGVINEKDTDLSGRYVFYVRTMALTDKRKRNIAEADISKF